MVTKGISFHQDTGEVKWEHRITEYNSVFPQIEHKPMSLNYKLSTETNTALDHLGPTVHGAQ